MVKGPVCVQLKVPFTSQKQEVKLNPFNWPQLNGPPSTFPDANHKTLDFC